MKMCIISLFAIACFASSVANANGKPSNQQELSCVLAALNGMGIAAQANTALYATTAGETGLYEIVRHYPEGCETFWPGLAAAAAKRGTLNCKGLTFENEQERTTASCIAAAINAGRDAVTK
jgi:hypothetical protein